MTVVTKTVNGIGWEIQGYTPEKGWVNPLTNPDGTPLRFTTFTLAKSYLARLCFEPHRIPRNFRVYEVLEV